MKSSRPPRKGSTDAPARKASDQDSNILPVLLSNLSYLHSLLTPFTESHGLPPPGESMWTLYAHWITADCQVYERVVLAGMQLAEEEETLEKVLLGVDIHSGLNAVWRIRFAEKAIAHFLESCEDRRAKLVERVVELAQGKLDVGRKSTIVQCGPMRNLVVMYSPVAKEGVVLFALELNRLPLLSNSGLQGFAYHHFLRVIDFLPAAASIPPALKQYLNLMRADPAKCIHPEQARSDSKLVSLENSVKVQSTGIYIPMELPETPLRKNEVDQYSYNGKLGRWVHSTERIRDEWEDAQTRKANAALISELADSESCKHLIEFIQSRVRHFPFQMSPEELNVIGTPGNVLVIGRSGTGKTTCAMLRLLASQALFRQRIRQQKRDSSGFFGLHSVFITASATLTLEVKRFYESLVAKLANKPLPAPTQPTEEDETEMNEKDLKIKPSTMLMTHEDFPLFSTTRLLVFAIDAGLRNPFFRVSEEGEGAAVQAGFHNELKGVKVISHLVRREELDDNFDFQAEDAGFQEVSVPLNQDPADLLDKETSFEVSFDYFERHFWPTVRNRGSVSAALAWAEISGKLKGSAASASYATGYIPKEVYMTQHKKTSLLGNAEREIVWTMFQQYEKWKDRQGAYDFQDVVTHGLKEIELSGYEGAPIHFMMVDEVQDLTHATLLLLSKVTEQHLFFSGDTAQTIAKGSTFRFKELSTLFARDGLDTEPPTTKQLLVNYRSHNGVLKLANSVVRLIELLFPKSIDKLERERSESDGDMPIILLNPCLEEIVNALVVGETATNHSIVYGSGQVVLVPDDTARRRLPEILQGALCLTIYESKGMEFDDVILFEFFENCGVTEDQWRLLRDVLYEDRESRPADIYSEFWKPKVLLNFDSARHSALCTALKMLYVAITRTKRKFIVYDASPSGRYLLDYWLEIGIATKRVPQETGLETDIGQVIQSEAGRTLWRNLGIKLMKLKFYSQAAKCFTYADDARLKKKAESLHTADECGRILGAAEALLQDKKTDMETRASAEVDKKAAMQRFAEVAKAFLELGLKRYAAQCYFSGQLYNRAANIYKELGAFSELGACLLEEGRFKDAGRSYRKAGNLLGALRAYDRGKCWIDCVNVLCELKTLSLGKRVALIRKYCTALAEEVLRQKQRPVQKTVQDFVPVVQLLTATESQQITSKFGTADIAVPVNHNFLLDAAAEVVASSSQDCDYGYSYLRYDHRQPRGQLIKFDGDADSPEVSKTLIHLARIFEADAEKLQQRRADARRLTTQFAFLPPEHHSAQAICVFEVFRLKKLSFLLACSTSQLDYLKSTLEEQCVCASPVHAITPESLASSQWPRLGRYFSIVPGKSVHLCLEMMRSEDVAEIAETEDSLYPGMVALGLWKKVVSLTGRESVVAAFRDFKNAKLLYARNEKLSEMRIQQLFENPQNWSARSGEMRDREFLFSMLAETIERANGLISITLHCDFSVQPVAFNKQLFRNNILWSYLQNPDDGDHTESLNNLLQGIDANLQDSTRKNKDPYSVIDVFSFFVQFVFSLKTDQMQHLLKTTSFEMFEKMILSFQLWVSILERNEVSRYVRNYDLILRATLLPLGISLLTGDDYLAALPTTTHALLHKSSVLYASLAAKNLSLLCVDTEGSFFLAPISAILHSLLCVGVQRLTDITMLRKTLYVKHRFSRWFPFQNNPDICNERLRARTAACIYGELAHLKVIQSRFPGLYRFVGSVGEKMQLANARKLAEVSMEISELSGDGYAADDPTFASFLKSKNLKEIKKLEAVRRSLLQRGSALSEEQDREEEQESFLHSLPLDVHHELVWMFDPRVPLTRLAQVHLRNYIKGEMADLNPDKDAAKLRTLDNISRLCFCRQFLRKLLQGSSPLLFPEVEFFSGNLAEVISQSLNASKHESLDFKDKFQIIQKCILWSLVLTRVEIVLPSLLALQLTRYYGAMQKVIQKRFLPTGYPCMEYSMKALLDLLQEFKKKNKKLDDANARDLYLTLVTLFANIEFNEKYPSLLFKIVSALEPFKADVRERNFIELLRLKIWKWGKAVEMLRKTMCVEGAINEVRIWVTEKKQLQERKAVEKSKPVENPAVPTSESPPQAQAFPPLTAEESKPVENPAVPTSESPPQAQANPPLTAEEREKEQLQQERLAAAERKREFYNRLRFYKQTLELVTVNDPLSSGESEMMRSDYHRLQQDALRYENEELAKTPYWNPDESVQYEDLLLLAEFNNKLIYSDVYKEYKCHFRDEFSTLRTLNEKLCTQLEDYRKKTASAKQRLLSHSCTVLLAQSAIKLKHDLLQAILKCRDSHEDGEEPSPPTLEESRVHETREEVDRVMRKVDHTDLSTAGGDYEDKTEGLASTEDAISRWKVTKR